MGQYNEMIITNEGLSLLAKAQLEAGSMIFTSVKTGNGTYDGSEDLRSETSLKSVKHSFQISSVEQEDSSKLKIRCLLSNDEVSIGYDISEIGVYGKIDQSEEEKMIGIATAVKPDFFPSHDVSPSSILFEIYIKVANCNNVNFEYTIPEGVYELAQNAEEKYNRFAEHIADKNNPHNVTAEGIGAAEADHTHANATTTAAGFMSASDKVKLDGVVEGANKTTVDTALSATSTNPVQNKVIKDALDGKLPVTVIDTPVDFNSLTQSGIYLVITSGCDNEPPSGSEGVLFVSGAGEYLQYHIGYSDDTLYTRYCYHTVTWQPWKLLNANAVNDSEGNVIVDTYAKIAGPVFTGSISMGRKSGSTVGTSSVALGYNTTASGSYSYALGYGVTTSANYSYADGYYTKTSGGYSHAEGRSTTALQGQHAQGHYNNTTLATANSVDGTSAGTAFVIGNGTSSNASNAFRVTGQGAVYAKAAYNATGADYAEFAEWADGNPDNEDRRGYFVTFDEDKPEMIRKANAGDYILGVVSGNPCVIGNSDEAWLGQYEFDEFGAPVYETTEQEETYIDEETGEEKTRTVEVTFYKMNPDYDPAKQYVHRKDRPEWDYIGWIGVLSVRDDGSCTPGSYCKATDGGIATAAERGIDTYRVLSRVTENVIKIAVK